MPLPQDIRPVFQDIQDTLMRSDSPWIERSPQDKLKIISPPIVYMARPREKFKC